jgi:uncharacterized phiE125 gp8 family phage protein
MGLQQITQPAVEPLTVQEVKTHLRIDTALGEIAPVAPVAALAATPAAGNLSNGVYRYLCTFVTADGETDAGAVSNSVTVANNAVNGKIDLSGIPTGGSAVTARKIYRTAHDGSSFLLAATISNNSTTTYTDNLADASLGASAPSSNTTQDPYLSALIVVARRQAESITKRRFITQQWKQTLDWWPIGITFRLLLPPIQNVSAVQYYDQNSTLQTLDPASYEVSYTQQQARVSLLNGYWWPTLRIMKLDPVVITFTTGYGDTAASVPQGIKQAMLLMIAHWYNQREDVLIGTQASVVPKAADMLLAPYKVWEF